MVVGAIRNAIGRRRGFGSCEKCDDTWNWKEYFVFRYGPQGMFPLCKDCWKNSTDEEKKRYMRQLVQRWQRDTPEDGERYLKILQMIDGATHEELEQGYIENAHLDPDVVAPTWTRTTTNTSS